MDELIDSNEWKQLKRDLPKGKKRPIRGRIKGIIINQVIIPKFIVTFIERNDEFPTKLKREIAIFKRY